MIQIIINKRTPTVNLMYGHNMKGHFYIKPEGRKIREEIDELIKNLKIGVEDYRNKKLKVKVRIFENWFTKKGEVKKRDISNREKFLIDSVFKSLGLEDMFIWEHLMLKEQSEEEKAIIEIKLLGETYGM